MALFSIGRKGIFVTLSSVNILAVHGTPSVCDMPYLGNLRINRPFVYSVFRGSLILAASRRFFRTNSSKGPGKLVAHSRWRYFFSLTVNTYFFLTPVSNWRATLELKFHNNVAVSFYLIKDTDFRLLHYSHNSLTRSTSVLHVWETIPSVRCTISAMTFHLFVVFFSLRRQ